MKIPDLRQDNEITLEHCSVLLEKLGETLNIIEGVSAFDVTDLINPENLLNHYQEEFEPEAFTRLFYTELGKGVLVGTYAMKIMDKITLQEAEEILEENS